MFARIRRHTETIVVAMITAMVTAGAPAIAHGVNHALFAHNADKVDGKHAVASGASTTQRAGKLVATDSTTGKLPDDIIAQAQDSAALQGLSASDFVQDGDSVAWSLLTGIPSEVGAIAGGTALSNSVTAPNFLYSAPRSGRVFADPAHCQRAVGFEAPYKDAVVYHPPANGLGPAIGAGTSAAGEHKFYCPVPLQVPPGATLTITGADVQLLDYNATCYAAAKLRTKPFGATSIGSEHASVYSGTGSSDYASTSADPFGRVNRQFTGLSVGVSPSTVVFIEAIHANAPTGGASECRYNGAVIDYTVDRP